MNYNLKNLSDRELKLKIGKAYNWLMAHDNPLNPDSFGLKIALAGNSWNFSPEEYQNNLSFYEQCVDEAKTRGIEEKDYWNYNDENKTVDNMSLEETVYTVVK